MSRKGFIKNHKTGKSGGDNDKIYFEKHTSRKGLDDFGNLVMDVFEVFSNTKNQNQRSYSHEVVSAYVEKDGSTHTVVVSFSNGDCDTRRFNWSSDANDFLHRIKRSANLIELKGSSFTISNSRVMVNKRYITNVDKVSSNELKISFKNDTAITIDHSLKSYMDENLEKLGVRQRPTFSFAFGSAKRRTRIEDILDI